MGDRQILKTYLDLVKIRKKQLLFCMGQHLCWSVLLTSYNRILLRFGSCFWTFYFFNLTPTAMNKNLCEHTKGYITPRKMKFNFRFAQVFKMKYSKIRNKYSQLAHKCRNVFISHTRKTFFLNNCRWVFL